MVNNNRLVTTFESSGEFLDYIKTCERNSSWASDNTPYEINDKWYGTKNMEQAIQFAENGWHDGMTKVCQKIDVAKIQGKGKSRINDLSGDYPIVARAIAGLPDSMSRRVTNNASKKPILDIILRPAYAGIVDSENAINYGAAVCELIDSCESVGYSVNLIVANVSITCITKEKIGCVFPLKKAGEAMDIEKIIFTIANPSQLRRLVFKYYQSVSVAGVDTDSGYAAGEIANSGLTEFGESGAIILNAKTTERMNMKTVDEARKYLKLEIMAQRPDMIDALSEAA